MTKLRSAESITCPSLEEAYEQSLGRAFDKIEYPRGVYYDEAEYGHAVSSKRLVVGEATCSENGCEKRIMVHLNFKPIKGRNIDGEEATIYDAILPKIAINTSGHECKRGSKIKNIR